MHLTTNSPPAKRADRLAIGAGTFDSITRIDLNRDFLLLHTVESFFYFHSELCFV